MELERRHRRQRKDQQDAGGGGGEDARSIHDVSDDLLWRILLRLDSPMWLIRAACACKRWRHVVTDGADQGRAFLRLARSLHPPPVVGQYHNTIRGDTRFVPSSSHIDSSRFCVDFLDENPGWCVADCHGGLVLLRIRHTPSARSVPKLIVYDALTRQHWWIYSLHPNMDRIYRYGSIRDAFLLNGDDGNISISNFRVLYRCQWLFSIDPFDADLKACLFSTANCGDRRFLIDSADNDIFRSSYTGGHMAGHVDGSLYLGFFMGCIIAMDNTKLVFSMVGLPIRLNEVKTTHLSTFTVVHGAGLAPTGIVHVCGEELQLFRQVHGSGEWVLEQSIANLSEATRGLSVCLENCSEMEWRTMMNVITDGTEFAVLSAYSRRGDYDSGYDKSWFLNRHKYYGAAGVTGGALSS